MLNGIAVELALVSHTNSGKTTLARTLLGRDIGEVRDAPHVTEIAEPHVLLESGAGDLLRLWDTPGFGDSARLVRRLRVADNPIGWFLRELWDRHRDRPLWCSQQAVRAARETCDVVLYLVNAAEDPRDAGYVPPEMQVLRWVGKPVVVLLNQIGPPRPDDADRAEVDRWRAHLEPFGVVSDVLALDAFARCWVQERVLLEAVARVMPPVKRDAFARLTTAWVSRSLERFHMSMRTLGEELGAAACDVEPVDIPDIGTLQTLLRAIGMAREARDPARDRAMDALAERLDRRIRTATDRLIALHQLHGGAAQTVLERLREHFATKGRVDEGRAALWGSVLTGALTGLKADLAAGGLTLGAGMLVGSIVGGLAGAGVARGINKLSGADKPVVRWSDDFLDGLVRSTVLRYLAVAHFGRGRGRWVEGEAPAFWQTEVDAVVSDRKAAFQALWRAARDAEADDHRMTTDLTDAVTTVTVGVLDRLYPGQLPEALGPLRCAADRDSAAT